ncbi:exonuclease SbcCD subunit D [Aggregatilineales bacterium SYSU G02658]
MSGLRVIHFADLHVGIENYGGVHPETGVSLRVVDFLARLDEIVAFAADHETDLVVFAGDAFQHARPDPTLQRAFARRILQLADLAPVILLVGNHDIQANAAKASSVDIYQTLNVPNVLVAEAYAVHPVQTARGLVVVGTAPYPIRARLLESGAGLKSMREINQYLQQTVTDALDKLAQEADQLAGDAPRLLLGHFTVSGSKVGSERTRLLGTDESISLGVLADPRWDYVALGHIHRFQDLTAGREGVPPVVYSGSLERVDFGEEGQEKGFCYVTLARGATRYEFIEVNARPLVTVEVDCRTADNPTAEVIARAKKHDLANAIVRLRIVLNDAQRHQLDERDIRAKLKGLGAHHVAAFETHVERADRVRLGSKTDGLTHEELLRRFFVSNGKSADEIEALLAVARAFMEDPE